MSRDNKSIANCYPKENSKKGHPREFHLSFASRVIIFFRTSNKNFKENIRHYYMTEQSNKKRTWDRLEKKTRVD